MKKKKKNKYIFAFLGTVFGLFCGVTAVSAATLNYDFSGYYYERGGNGSSYDSWRLENYFVDGNAAFCIEPGIEEAKQYGEVTWDKVPLSNDVKEQIMLIGYYGYQYPEHQTVGYRAATQGLMWEAILGEGSYVKYSTERYGKGTKLDDSKERQTIRELISKHYIKPSMNGKTYTVQVGQPLVIEDANKVLSNFELYGENDADVIIENNTLTIVPKKIGKINIRFVKKQVYSRNYLVYYAEGYQNMFTGGNVDPVVFSINLDSLGGKVELQKNDSINKNNIPSGEASLNGAIYGIYDEADNLIQTLTTDEYGKAISNNLPYFQKYYIQEIKPSEGYQLDKTKYYFTSNKDELITYIKVFENVITRDFDFTKVYASDKTQIMIPESGIEFGIFDRSNNLITKKVTDKSGKILVTLPYGNYILRQLTSTPNYEKIEDYYFEVKELGDKINKVFSNAEIKAKLKVIKIDADSKKQIKLANIKFKIFDLTRNEYVCQNVTYPTSEKICEFRTDKNGVLITPYSLLNGKYQLEEVDQKIDGYLWNPKSKVFEIGENADLVSNGDYGIVFETSFENKQVKGEVEITKFGEELVMDNGTFYYKEIKLDKVNFDLYANDNIFSRDGTLIYHKDEKINSFVTKDGKIKISDLYLGKYYIIETSTIGNHVLDSNKHEFELTYIDQYTPVVKLCFSYKNYLEKGVLEFTKTDLSTGKEIPGTKIEIYTDKGSLIFSGMTDKDGKIKISNLFVGKFYIIETEPSNGYQVSNEKVYFEIKENNEIVKANMTNELIVEVPNTESNKSYFINIISLILILAGIGYLFYDKNNKK